MNEFRKYLKSLGVGGIKEAARRLQCSRQHIYNILNGDAEIDKNMADAIHKDSRGKFDRSKLLWG